MGPVGDFLDRSVRNEVKSYPVVPSRMMISNRIELLVNQ